MAPHNLELNQPLELIIIKLLQNLIPLIFSIYSIINDDIGYCPYQ